MFLLAKSADEAKQMARDLTTVLYTKGFRWKASSLECFAAANVDPLSFTVHCPTGEALKVKSADQIVALGVLLDRVGSTEASIDYRMVQADRMFYKHAAILSNRYGGLLARLRAYCQSVVPC